jgi:hypothetical protein
VINPKYQAFRADESAKTLFTIGFPYSNILGFQVRDLNNSGRFPDFERWIRKHRTENVSLDNRLLCLPG